MTTPGRGLTRRQWLALFAGLMLPGYLAYFWYSLATGQSRVRDTCNRITPGMTTSELKRFVENTDFDPPRLETPRNRVVLKEFRTMGRFICEVTFENDVVTSTKYFFMD